MHTCPSMCVYVCMYMILFIYNYVYDFVFCSYVLNCLFHLCFLFQSHWEHPDRYTHIYHHHHHHHHLFETFCGFCQRRQWHPTPVLLPGKFHGQRSLDIYFLLQLWEFFRHFTKYIFNCLFSLLVRDTYNVSVVIFDVIPQIP